ncbi:sensor histidine kinase [Actinorhabdospora filicis]|nr:sensor histidine kinase [Actinorhabdospora filicis]
MREPWWLREKDRLLVAVDAGIAVLMAVPAVMGVLDPMDLRTFHGWFLVTGLLVALSYSLPMSLRRRWPRAIYVVVLAATVVADVIEVSSGASAAAAWVLYIVARDRARRESLVWLGAGAGSIGLILVASRIQLHAEPNPYGQAQAGLGLLLFGLAWVVGYMARRHKEMVDAVAAEARRRDRVEARLHLAREVHDVVAHNLSVITVKAGVALHVAGRRPEEAVDTLRVIERTGRTALAEVRQLVETLRNDVPAAAGLAGLPELVESAAEAGVTVTVERDLPPLPPGLEASVFRIVQEAVTNTVKHAAPARCRVTIGHDERHVRIEAVDDGDARRAPLPGGHGLIGVRERVEAYGGVFTAGPVGTGGPGERGWRLAASLPYQEVR